MAATKAGGRKPWVLYRISVLDYRNDYRTVTDRGYLGISERVEGEYRTTGGKRVHGAAPYARFLEHSAKKPFGDIIVGQPEVVETFDCKEDAEEGELEAISRERPQYNIDGNPDHRDRVCPWDQATHRAERDAARAAGTSLHGLGHSRYVTTNRTRPDRPKPRREPGQTPAAAPTAPPRVNGHNHTTDPATTRPARSQNTRRRRPAKASPAPPAAPPRPVGSVLFRRLVVALGVGATVWIVAAVAAAAAGWALPAEIAAPTSMLLGTVLAIWRYPTT